LWLRLPQSAPESVFFEAPELEPRANHPFGRAPLEAGFGAARGALPNRLYICDHFHKDTEFQIVKFTA